MPKDYSMAGFLATVDIAIMGRKTLDSALKMGRDLARDFLKADLVDEFYLGIVPVLLGEGIPLVPSGFPQRDFALEENKTYSKGLIGLRYEWRRSKGNRRAES